MALYAFDGTWNYDKPSTENDTNVVRFRDVYADGDPARVDYVEGIGAHYDNHGAVRIDKKENPLSKFIGGMTGAGGHPRVKEMLGRFAKRLQAGDSEVHVVGFSRGSALAVDFVNRLAKKHPTVRVQFLGIWDMVPAFGLSIIPWDPSWKLDLPETVEKCYHAMALDERRPDFHLRRPKAKRVGQLTEVWFRGVHSDVGGGNANLKRSSIALNWMFRKAQAAQLHIPDAAIQENEARMDPKADISKHAKFWLEIGRRRVDRGDLIHSSVLNMTDAEHPEYVQLDGLSVLYVDNDDKVVLHSHMDPADGTPG